MNVFLDTSAVFALQNEDDPHHPQAVKIKERLKAEGTTIHTHEWIVLESISLVRKRLGAAAAARTIQFFRGNPGVTVHFMEGEAMEEVLVRFESRPALGMIDTASFFFMKRLGIKRVFTFDRDFAAAGFEVEGA